jgi:hypothetical protein
VSRRDKVQYLNVAVRCLGCRTPYIASQTVRYFYTREGYFSGKEKEPLSGVSPMWWISETEN